MTFNSYTSGTENLYKFGGKEEQKETGWYDYIARQFDPQLGRFTSVDPHAGNYYAYTPYNYVGNNPINLVDKDGKDWSLSDALDVVQVGLDVAGMIPAVGNFADVANAGISLARGNYVEAGLNLMAAIPGAGQGVTGLKLAKKAETASGMVSAAMKAGDKVNDAAKALDKGSDAAKAGDGIIYKRTNPKTGDEYIGQAKSESHYSKRQSSHDKAKGTKHDYEVVDTGKPGTDLNVKEETHIRQGGGPNNKSTNGSLENKRHQMSDENYKAAGGTAEKNY